MALTEHKVISRISLHDSDMVEIREDTVVMRDGVEIAKIHHRRVIAPDSDTAALPARIKKLTDAFWTPQVIQKYKDDKAEREARETRP